MKTKVAKWFHAAGIRALKTVSQTAIAMLGTSMLLSEVDWLSLLSASVLSGLLSLFTSIAGLPELKTSEENEDDDN